MAVRCVYHQAVTHDGHTAEPSLGAQARTGRKKDLDSHPNQTELSALGKKHPEVSSTEQKVQIFSQQQEFPHQLTLTDHT